MNVVLTREQGKNDDLRQWLSPDAVVSEVPLTTTAYFENDVVRTALEGSISNGAYGTLVVTSERSVRYVALALAASRPDATVYCVGPRTSAALQGIGVDVRVTGDGPAVSLAPEIARGPVLVLGAVSMRDELVVALRAKGLDVVTIACYETIGLALNPSDADTLRRADVVFIGAPSAWAVARAFVEADTWVVVPGVTTAAAVIVDHQRVLQGWGPELRTRLDALSPER